MHISVSEEITSSETTLSSSNLRNKETDSKDGDNVQANGAIGKRRSTQAKSRRGLLTVLLFNIYVISLVV